MYDKNYPIRWCNEKAGIRMRKDGRKEAGRRHFDWFLFVVVCIVSYFSYTVFFQQLTLNAVDRDYEAAQVRLKTAKEEN